MSEPSSLPPGPSDGHSDGPSNGPQDKPPYPGRTSGPEGKPQPPPSSLGNIGEHHWTRSRSTENQAAIDYYRERSKAPGVAEGGEERNHYCLECDGVIPHDASTTSCPHCGAEIEGHTKRYFNWVEIDDTTDSDLKALLPWLILGLALLLGVAVGAWFLFS